MVFVFVFFITEDFIQSVQDVAIAFGLAPNADIDSTSRDTLLSSKYIGPSQHFRNSGIVASCCKQR